MKDCEILNSVFFTDFKFHYKNEILYRCGKLKELPPSTVDFIKSYQGSYIYERCVQLSYNRFKRISRLRARIRLLLEFHQCYFLTLTFSDTCFKTTSYNTRHTYVVRLLKSLGNNVNYVCNVDYGDKNGREHYHAIVNVFPPRSLMKEFYLKCGIYHIEKIRSTSNDRVLALYVDKFKLHNMKVDYNFKTIYSRGYVPEFFVESRFSDNWQMSIRFNNLATEHIKEVTSFLYPD